METPRVRLGELLVRAGLVTGEQLEEALEEQRRAGKRLGALLIERGLVTEAQVTQILSQQLSIPWVSLHHIDFSAQLLDLVPKEIAEKYCIIPIYVRRVRGLGDALYVAMEDPTNATALEEVALRSGLHVRAMIAPPSDIRSAIAAYYGDAEHEAPDLEVLELPHGGVDPEEDIPTGVHSRAHLMNQVSAASSPPAAEPEAAAPGVLEVAAPSAPEAPEVASAEPPRVEESPMTSRSGPPPEPVPVAKRPARKMVALTFLDGTTIKLPSKGGVAQTKTPGEAKGAAAPSLTARELVEALRAASQGQSASEALGEDVRWEAMFAALLSLLLEKQLIADWEFVEEYRKKR